MYYLHHVHPASASVQSVYLPRFLPDRPCLCVVRHSSLSFLALDGDGSDGRTAALDELFSVPINGRVLKVERIAGQRDGLAVDRLGVLTDHHQPRFIVLRYEGAPSFTLAAEGESSSGSADWTEVRTDAAITLEELGRPAAESGLTLEVERGEGARYGLVHTHVGTVKVCKLLPDRVDLGQAFSLRTPHPHLISSVFLSRPSSTAPSIVAMLSLSSVASRLPGLGMQCLPVLSFHVIDEAKQELVPLPWGAPAARPMPVNEEASSSSSTKPRRRSSQTQASQSMPGTLDPAGKEKTGTGKKHGPAAAGATRTAEEELAAEESMAKSAYGMAHVPIPFTDALGAHMLLPLPARAGRGVLVFCEATVLLVPAPPITGTDVRRAEGVRSPKLSPGKRRKSSITANVQEGGGEVDSSALSTSPTTVLAGAPPRSNENGKRRRSTASSAVSAGTESAPGARRRSSAGFACAGRRIHRLDVPPMIVTASVVVQEPSITDDDGVREGEDGGNVKVLFVTHAGRLHLLNIVLKLDQAADGKVPSFAPVAMTTQIVGDIPAPASQGGLTYLGENFIHVASTGGDPLIGRISDQGIDVVSSWPNLAPILDFVVDDGLGGDPTNARSAQARVITCSGSGATGSLRTIRNGVTMSEMASIEEVDVRSVFEVRAKDGQGTALLVCSYQDHTRFFAFQASGLADVTDAYTGKGYDATRPVIATSHIDGGWFVVVTSTAVFALPLNGVEGEGVRWMPADASDEIAAVPSANITQAAVNAFGQVLLAFPTGHIVHLQAQIHSIQFVASLQLECEASALDISPIGTTNTGRASLAAVSLWKPSTVKLLALPDLRDVTPAALLTSQPSLVRSVKLHVFAEHGRAKSAPQLLIGLGDGTLVSHSLSLPTENSISQSIGVLERRLASLGSRPVVLRSFTTSQGLHAVLAISDRSSVVFARSSGLTYSAIGQQDLVDICDVSYPTSNDYERLTAFVLQDGIRLVQVGEISKVHIGATPLGHDNPLALTMCAERSAIGVVTTRFLPEGRGEGAIEGGKVLLRDLITLEGLDSLQLEEEERPNCIDTLSRGTRSYLVVGTGYAFPDRTETTSGRILVLEIDAETRKLHLTGSHNVEGNVFDIKAVGRGRIVACVNAKVISFEIEEEDEDDAMDQEKLTPRKGTGYGRQRSETNARPLTLLMVDEWACAFTATTVSLVKTDRLVIGDALRSIVVLRIDEGGKLVELARDCDPYWTVACDVLNEDDEVYIGSDIAFNLWTCKRLKWTQAAKNRIEQNRLRETETGGRGGGGVNLVDQTWSHIMQRDAAYHYGDLVNKMRRGALVAKGFGAQAAVESRVVFATAAGAIGVIAELDERAGRILSQLEMKINDAWSPIGRIAADDYRTLRTDHRTQTAAGFLDGDAIKRGFERLTFDQRSRLAQRGRLAIDADVDELNRLVEALDRLS